MTRSVSIALVSTITNSIIIQAPIDIDWYQLLLTLKISKQGQPKQRVTTRHNYVVNPEKTINKIDSEFLMMHMKAMPHVHGPDKTSVTLFIQVGPMKMRWHNGAVAHCDVDDAMGEIEEGITKYGARVVHQKFPLNHYVKRGKDRGFVSPGRRSNYEKHARVAINFQNKFLRHYEGGCSTLLQLEFADDRRGDKGEQRNSLTIVTSIYEGGISITETSGGTDTERFMIEWNTGDGKVRDMNVEMDERSKSKDRIADMGLRIKGATSDEVVAMIDTPSSTQEGMEKIFHFLLEVEEGREIGEEMKEGMDFVNPPTHEDVTELIGGFDFTLPF
jgi:hypothetical protein